MKKGELSSSQKKFNNMKRLYKFLRLLNKSRKINSNFAAEANRIYDGKPAESIAHIILNYRNPVHSYSVFINSFFVDQAGNIIEMIFSRDRSTFELIPIDKRLCKEVSISDFNPASIRLQRVFFELLFYKNSLGEDGPDNFLTLKAYKPPKNSFLYIYRGIPTAVSYQVDTDCFTSEFIFEPFLRSANPLYTNAHSFVYQRNSFQLAADYPYSYASNNCIVAGSVAATGQEGSYIVNQKLITLHRDTALPYSASVSPFLIQMLFGNDASLLRQFQSFLCDVWSNDAPGMTVLYTKNNKSYLTHLLLGILDETLYRPGWRDDNTQNPSYGANNEPRPVSLKVLMKNTNLIDLYVKQYSGISAVMVKDRPLDPIADAERLRILQKLLSGKTIYFHHDVLPRATKFKNHLHFICVTSDYRAARQLLSLCPKGHGRLIDFSSKEASLLSGLIIESDLLWFRTSFLLHGLKQKHRSAVFHPQNDDDGNDSKAIVSYLTKYCSFHSGSYTTPDSLFQSFLKVFPHTQWTNIRFNKVVRELLPKYYPKVEYQRRQWIEHPDSGTRRQTTIYRHLQIRDIPITPAVSPESKSSLQQMLEEIANIQLLPPL